MSRFARRLTFLDDQNAGAIASQAPCQRQSNHTSADDHHVPSLHDSIVVEETNGSPRQFPAGIVITSEARNLLLFMVRRRLGESRSLRLKSVPDDKNRGTHNGAPEGAPLQNRPRSSR